ncbi:hypothetical protein [Vibrio crassostreae]|uniref:hypothetical protein n=1 Tax=Vibrio crassostreae TaxID=246167 RepID=UPI001B30056E|nr:hypothetical protein [Vibrio crassostreae]
MSSFSDSVFSAIDKQKDINSLDKEKMIVGLHGVNLQNFITVTESGGFACPSLAIMKMNKDRKDEKEFRFASGSILVAFKPDIIFDGKVSAPKADNQTIITTGDGYTVRAPAEHLKLGRSALNKLEKDLIELDSPFIDSLHKLRLSRPDNSWLTHFNNFSENPLIKHLFLSENGIDLPVPMKRVKPAASGFGEFLLKNKTPKQLVKLMQGDIQSEIEQIRDLHVEHVKERYAKFDDTDDPKIREFVQGEIESAKDIETHKLSSKYMTAEREVSQYLSKKMQIDTKKLDVTMSKAMKKAGGHPEFLSWVTSKVRNMTMDRYFKADDKQITKEHKVIEYIRQNRGVGQEGLSSVTVGEVKSYATSRVNSFKELFERSDLLTRNEDEYKDDNLSEALSDFRVAMSHKTSISFDTRAESEAIRMCVKEFCLRSQPDLSKIARSASIDHLDESEMKEIHEAGMKLKDAYSKSNGKVPYFEAVINERVGFDMVESIVVPKDWEQTVKKFLDRNNIKDVNIKVYNPKVDGSQMKQVPASLNLEKHAQKIKRQNAKKRSLAA